jgi:hypothetical protein
MAFKDPFKVLDIAKKKGFGNVTVPVRTGLGDLGGAPITLPDSSSSGSSFQPGDISATLPITWNSTTKTIDFDASTTNEQFSKIGVNKSNASASISAEIYTSNGGQGLRIENATSTDIAFSTYTTGDAQVRFRFAGTGLLGWGDGSASVDTNLYRSAANTLKTDDAFVALGGVTADLTGNVSGNVTGNLSGNVTGNVTGDLTGNVNLTAAPGSDHTASGIKITLTANENQNFGDVCYIDSSGEAHLADADAIATSSVVVMCADSSISANNSGNYLLFGIARDDTWNWTAGSLIYLSLTGTTGNTLTATAPSAVNDVVQIIGVATHADRIFFKPSLVQVERL